MYCRLQETMIIRNKKGSIVPYSLLISDAFENGEKVLAYAVSKQVLSERNDVVESKSSKRQKMVIHCFYKYIYKIVVETFKESI